MQKSLILVLFILFSGLSAQAQGVYKGGVETVFAPLASELCIKTENGASLADVQVAISGGGNNIPAFIFMGISNANGCINLAAFPLSANGIITPGKNDNPLNGVSTYDLVLLSKHILGIQPLGSPYKMIAADANRSGSISTFDVIEIRKLILGIYVDFPNNKSWRFVPKNYTFPNQQNPFASVFPETILLSQVSGPQPTIFTAIKVGDLNGNAIANSVGSDERSALTLFAPDRILQAGETAEIPVSFLEEYQLLGLQLELACTHPDLKIESIQPGNLPDMDAASFVSSADAFSCSWATGMPQAIAPEQPLFTVRVRAQAPVRLSEALTINEQRLQAEAYDAEENPRTPIALTFFEPVLSNKTGEIGDARPNPSNGTAMIPLNLANEALVNFEFCDITGKLLYQFQKTMPSGQQVIQIPAQSMAHSGVYTWRIRTAGVEKSGKLIRQ